MRRRSYIALLLIALPALAHNRQANIPPSIDSFAPAQALPGQTVTVQVEGAGFLPGTVFEVGAPGGVTVLRVVFDNPRQAEITLRVEDNAAPGMRPLYVQRGHDRNQARGGFLVQTAPGQPVRVAPPPAAHLVRTPQSPAISTQAAIPQPVVSQKPATMIPIVQPIQAPSKTARSGKRSQAGKLAPMVSSGPVVNVITPSQLVPGSVNVPLSITGSFFTPSTTVSFDSAIVLQGKVQFVNSTKLKAVVNVAAGAQMGAHEVTVTNPHRHNVQSQISVVAAAKRLAIPSVQTLRPKFAPLVSLKEGVVNLDDPKWGSMPVGDITENFGMPVLDDETVLDWSEEHPGLADYYEIRFYARDGKTLLDTVRIDGTNTSLAPTSFHMDAATVATIMQKANQAETLQSNNSSAGGTLTLSDGDIQWEVAGFKQYSAPVQRQGVILHADALDKSSSLPSATLPQNADNATEIEISARWPLGGVNAPTGLANSSGVFNSTLDAIDVEATSVVDSYVGDTFMLQGNFNLTKAPYEPHVQNYFKDPTCNNLVCNFIGVQFDNLFIDWGDGTIEPIEASLQTPTTQWINGRGIALSMSTYMPAGGVPATANGQVPAITHQYSTNNSYQVRVFELAEADVQAINTSALAMALDESTSSFATGIKLAGFKLNGFNQPASGNNATSSSDSQSLAAIIARGYLLYSATEVVMAREDLLASGPLHLESITVNFNEPDQNASAMGGGVHITNSAAGRTDLAIEKSRVNPAATTTQTNQPIILSPTYGPHCSQCDESMMATATLRYYGQGVVRINWYIDDELISSETYPIGPSTQRTAKTDPPLPRDGLGTALLSTKTWNSPALNGASLGSHMMHAEAEVVPSLQGLNLGMVHNQVLEGARLATISSSAVTGAKTQNTSVRPDLEAPGGSLTHVQFSNLYLHLAQNRAGVSQKFGVLSPNRRAAPGIPAVVNLQTVMGSLAGDQSQTTNLPKEVPYYVVSTQEQYNVDANGPGPCTFVFPTKDGFFHVTGLQNHVTQNSDGTYSGTGKLVLYLTDSPSSAGQLSPVIVPIDHWQIGADGKTVQQGSFDVSPGASLQDMPAVAGTLQRVTATAGAANDLMATLALQMTDSTLRTSAAPQLPPVFSAQAAPLSSSGDWYISGVPMPEILIGWSAFRIRPNNGVAIDLSRTEGNAISSVCGSGGDGAGFVGIHFGNATLVPYTMELAEFTQQVPDWGISGFGICGSLDTGPYSAPYLSGQVSFDSLQAVAQNGLFNALYKNLTVHVPWLDLNLKADVPLQSGGGKQSAMQFNFPQPAPVTKSYANGSLTAKDFVFTKAQDIGWALYSTTTFNITAENKPFATVPDVAMIYGMNGIPYFAYQATSTDVALHGSSSLGSAPLDLVSVHITPLDPNSNQNHILNFDFATKVHLSTVLPAVDMPVTYELLRTVSAGGSATYSDNGPNSASFQVPFVFPPSDSSVHLNLKPVYQATADGTVFEEDGVDLGLFGIPGVTGSFKLGYGPSGDDYWIAKAAVPLGPTGVPIFDPFLTLYAITGGMGHNVSMDALTQPAISVHDVGYTANGGTLFSAGVTAGSSDDGFTYKADGDLTIKVGGSGAGARFSFANGSLLGGFGTFNGYFQYANNSFDGDMNATENLLDGAVKLNGDVNLHYGINDHTYHLDLGTKSTPISGTLLGISGANAYLMIGNDIDNHIGQLTIEAGGGASFHLAVGDNSVASAYVDGYMDVDMTAQISPPLHITGQFNAGADAGVCIADVCGSAGVTANVTASALPIQMTADASVDLGWPVGSVGFTVSLN